jgi:aryl-alcohol dehydrogenase-like predicted oxidoreductase
VIEAGRARAALERARDEALVGHIGLSADGPEARRALDVGGFETLQISFSLLEQEPLELIAEAARRGIGVIAKQPLANAIPVLDERPAHPDWARKWDRAQAIDWRADGSAPPLEVALRYVLDAPGVATAIVGTSRLEHLEANVRVAAAATASALA